jgi:hypothetical protein
VALFILLIVGVVIGQTWLDWRDTQRQIVIPHWVSGFALAGVVGASLTTATSMASFVYQDAIGEWASGFGSSMFWPQLGFLLCAMGIIIVAVRKKRIRILLLFAALLTAAFWLGMALST